MFSETFLDVLNHEGVVSVTSWSDDKDVYKRQMIGFIRGSLAEKGDGYIIVDVNGVGYEIFVPANSRAYLSSEGSEVMVYTAMTVREDDRCV